ncbi:hypothetical protein RJ639_035064 [Escallonia herrerae]|uniref:Uncharacterized protein n=1 Tax=Escallonia herrerae TaxID=1293975 RepID=A0AA89B8T7_9ASTE|nr:hypothetical protein RJ639_035064 [Escallonia herrerae]
MLESLLANSEKSGPEISGQIKDFTLCCAALASAQSSTYNQLSWIPGSLSEEANSAFCELSRASDKSDGAKLVIELMPEVLQYLQARIKESSIDTSDDVDQISAATARVSYPQLGKMSFLVIPCALTALDHWSPEVKSVSSFSFPHHRRHLQPHRHPPPTGTRLRRPRNPTDPRSPPPPARPSVVRAFSYCNTSLLLTVPNSLVPSFAANRSAADLWLYTHVVPFHPRARISAISVGFDASEVRPLLLPAIRNLHSSLSDLGLRHISVSTTFSFINTSPLPSPLLRRVPTTLKRHHHQTLAPVP